MFKYCPSCSSRKIIFEEGKIFSCPDCGFVYYQNIAAASGCLVIVPDADGNTADDRMLFLVRNREPGKGKLDLPGGFVDTGEGIFEGLYREMQEELGWTPPVPQGAALSDVFTLFASFSNVYKYKNIDYNTCDMYFTIRAPRLKPEDLIVEKDEIAGALFLKRQEIDLDKLAFTSTRRAVEVYLNKKSIK
ncbi:MAG: NUDIX domain-containing protein [Treponema sp.]|nr:NUDIX domain-containing protein [Treponema sp.]